MSPQRELEVTPRAARHIREAAQWWHEHRTGAPDAIREELERAFDLISLFPGVGAVARNPQLQGVRRLHLSRVHYDLYYRSHGSSIQVLAFWHSSRGSGPAL